MVKDGLTVTYSVSGTSNKGTNANSYTLTVSGTGNFTGTATATWYIQKLGVTIPTVYVKKAGSKTSTTISANDTYNQYYDGSAYGFYLNSDNVTPGGVTATNKDSTVTNVGSVTLTLSVDGNHCWGNSGSADTAAKTYQISAFLWDNGAKGYGKECHAYIDHGTGKYIGNSEAPVKAMVKAWTTKNPNYTLQSVYDSAPSL